MNILLLCDMYPTRPWVRDRLPGLRQAIKAYKNRIYIRDIYEVFGKEVSDCLRNHIDRDERLILPHIEISESYFMREVKKYDVDTIIFATADNYREFITLDFLIKLKLSGYNLVGFLGDDEFNHPQYRYLAAVFDNFVVYVEEYRKIYEKLTGNKGFLLLNSCHLAEFDNALDKSVKKYDTVMIGGPIPARVNILRKLKQEGFTIALYGPKSWQYFPEFKGNYKGFIETEEFDARLSEGEIILSMLEDHITGNLHMNTKIWECARAGCFTIASDYKPLFSDYGFVEGVDIVTYRDEADLINKFKYYHNNRVERENIRKKFLYKIKNELDYKILYLNLFNSIKSELNPQKSLSYLSAHKSMNAENKKLKGLYYNVINKGKPVKQYFPFISPQSIFHFKKSHRSSFWNYLYFVANKKNYFHVNLYRNELESFGPFSQLNRFIHRIKYRCVKPFYQKNLLYLKKKIFSA